MIKQGFLLKEDGDLYIKEAGEIAWPPEPIDNSPFWERAYHRSPAKVDTKIYKAYTGQYKAAVGGGIIIKISKKGKRLFLRIGGQPERELFPRSQTRYFTRDGLGELSFIKNAAGRVSKIVVHLRQGDIEASRI